MDQNTKVRFTIPSLDKEFEKKLKIWLEWGKKVELVESLNNKKIVGTFFLSLIVIK